MEINIHPFIEKLNKLKEYVNLKIDGIGLGFWIDIESLENIALGPSGNYMTPKEVMQMFFETGVLIYGNYISIHPKKFIPPTSSISAPEKTVGM